MNLVCTFYKQPANRGVAELTSRNSVNASVIKNTVKQAVFASGQGSRCFGTADAFTHFVSGIQER